MKGERQAALRPLRQQVIHGNAQQIAGWTVTPVARLISYARGRGTLRQRAISGWALGHVRIVPLGMLAEADGQEQWVATHDATTEMLGRMALAALATTLFLAAMRRLARRA